MIVARYLDNKFSDFGIVNSNIDKRSDNKESNKVDIEDIKNDIKSLDKIIFGVDMQVHTNYSNFENQVESKRNQKLNVSKGQLNSAKEYLQKEINNILSYIYEKEGSQKIKDAIEARNNYINNVSTKEDIQILDNGGYKLTDILMASPMYDSSNKNIGIDSISDNSEILEIYKQISKDMNEVSNVFFNLAQEYIPNDKLEKIQDALATIGAYYRNGENVEVNGFVYNYTTDGYNIVDIISKKSLGNLESFLLSAQTNMQKSMFDVLDIRDNNTYNSNTKYYKESKYDSIIKDILSMKETKIQEGVR
ncbi:hypothetical protein [Helicobacter sp. WB40]|uniref:hypothetical protein n=1 Tax=Helicobacter sp. WB40 TaxID=3004130 RepID=UPI0022EC12DC|nr:hypothetical protein [Helicobacter sp. WB40]MDA3967086.1 hypothetical protein [Helicobacter sp. WB40]